MKPPGKRVDPLQVSFADGEQSRLMDASALKAGQVPKSASTIENFQVTINGAIMRRRGSKMEWVTDAKDVGSFFGSPVIILPPGVDPGHSSDPYLRIPSCDFLVIRYAWTPAGGVGFGLDTRTAFIGTGTAVDNKDVGWGDLTGTLRYNAITPLVGSEYLMVWGGDSVAVMAESTLVNTLTFASNFPTTQKITLRCRANWFGARVSGDFSFEFYAYVGGAMSQDGVEWVNTGGVMVAVGSIPRNVASNVSGNVDGDDVATIVFDVASRSAIVVPA